MLSFIYPTFNRADLFARTLDTFVCQVDPGPYEILVVDDGSMDHLRDVVRHYAERWALPLRYLKIDLRGMQPPVIGAIGFRGFGVNHWPIFRDASGANNPAVAWNVGIQQARGEWVAPSSPEVCHRTPFNVQRLNQHTEPHVAIVADVYDRAWQDTEFQGWIGGGPKDRPLCFLARYDRAFLLRIGGFEEAFMAGRSYDDNEFAERFALNEGCYQFTHGTVVAEHLPHPRAQPGPADEVNRAIYERVRGQRVANQGREWGSAAVVVESWP